MRRTRKLSAVQAGQIGLTRSSSCTSNPADRRVVGESEALARFSDAWLVGEGDLIGLTRDEVRGLAHRRDRQRLRDEPHDAGNQQPVFGS